MKTIDSGTSNLIKKPISEKNPLIKGKVDSINNRQIRGWVLDLGHNPLSLSLLINNATYGLAPTWYDREDISTKFGEGFLQSGFIIDIPQAIHSEWAAARKNGEGIEVTANGVPLKKSISALKSLSSSPPKKANPKNQGLAEKLNKLFVCIGSQKAGTSWLFENLSQDPRFSRCPFVKEIHYFDYIYKNSPHLNNWRANFFLKTCQSDPTHLKPILSAWLSKNLDKQNQLDGNNRALVRKTNMLLNEITDEWYADMLRIRKNQEYAMDITPDYAVIGTEGFEHIKSVANQLKLLFILRDPVERAWSGLLQGKKQQPGGIAKFIEEKGEDIDFLFKACSTGPDIGARNNYLMTLEALEKVGLTDKQHLLITFYDDITNDPEQLIKDIYGFLEMPLPEMDIFSATLRSRVYATPKTIMPSELKIRLKAHYSPMLKQINQRFAIVPATWF